MSISLDRLILIDVDDIFVGERGTRLRPDDVLVSCHDCRTRILGNFERVFIVILWQALLETQDRLKRMVPGFKFNLGYSGKYFHHGTAEENLGDDLILGKKK